MLSKTLLNVARVAKSQSSVPFQPFSRQGQTIRTLLTTFTKRNMPSTFRSRQPFSMKRSFSSAAEEENNKVAIYVAAVAVAMLGLTYASVPLYKLFCQVTGFGGTVQEVDAKKVTVTKMQEDAYPVRVHFQTTVTDSLPWSFVPTQPFINVIPGETSLAFFTVKNKSDKAITGVATYMVNPTQMGLYFNKIQCFCFEEQRLRPGEEVDMPVLFFIDPDYLKEKRLKALREVTLSYNFFKTDEDEEEDEEENKEEED